MRYVSAGAFRAALERRLLDRSRTSELSLARLRKTVVFDRLLARLTLVAGGKWILKGALALDFRFQARARTTMDIDLGRGDDEEAAASDLLAAQMADEDDHFVFTIERTRRLDRLQEARAIRYQVACELAGRPFEQVRLDIAFGQLSMEPELISGPDLLAFADIAPVKVPTISLAQHLAEKLHAYVRDYGAHPVIRSTRVKDLVDMVLIASLSSLDATRLRRAIELTFQARASAPTPEELPPPPIEWATPYRKLAAEVGVEQDLGKAHAAAATLLDPILAAAPAITDWDPHKRGWK